MDILTAFFIYILIWWVMLFTVLPMGVTRHADEGRGFDAGAPARADLKKKLIINSILSFFILAVFYILFETGILNWEKIFTEPTW